jgi:hypothetical protein
VQLELRQVVMVYRFPDYTVWSHAKVHDPEIAELFVLGNMDRHNDDVFALWIPGNVDLKS